MQKIMFESRRFGLEQATIAGLKTLTHREVKFPKGVNDEDVESVVMGIDDKGRVYFTFVFADSEKYGTESIDIYPKYQIGERVAVAQSYASLLCGWGALSKRTDNGCITVKVQDNVDFTKGDFVIDGTKIPMEYDGVGIQAIHTKKEILDNKMFVKANLMPHVIEIINIKAERLNDISDEDCRKEGIIHVVWRQYPEQWSDHYIDRDLWTLEKWREHFEDSWSDDDPEAWAAETPKTAFIVLLAKLAHKQPKDIMAQNHWQIAYEYKLIK